MKDAATLLALADTVEALTGPDRNVDAEIADAIHWDDPIVYEDDPRLLAFTDSLDAGITLVPEGWRVYSADFSVKGSSRWLLEGPKLKRVYDEDGTWEAGDDWYCGATSATHANALTAAAIRAHAAIATGEGQSAVVGAHQPTGRSAGNDQMLPPTQPCG
jgi:hypothetical protein